MTGGYMAEPGTSEYITALQRRRRSEALDNITNNNPLLSALREHDAIDLVDGGRSLLEPMIYDENDTYTRYYGAQTISTAYNPNLTGAEFDWKQIAIAVPITGREERMSSGPNGKIKFATMRVKAAESTFENNFQADLLSAGTADSGLQIGGLAALISKTPTSGTVGGIARDATAGAFYRNQKFDTVNDVTAPAPGGAALTAATVRPAFNYCINACQRNSDGTRLIYAGQTYYQLLQSALEAIQRVTSESQTIKAGYRKLVYEGIPVFNGGGINFGGQTQIQTDLAYFIDPKGLKLQVHKDANYEPLPEVHSINQDAKVKLSIWMGNLTLSYAKGQLVMFDS